MFRNDGSAAWTLNTIIRSYDWLRRKLLLLFIKTCRSNGYKVEMLFLTPNKIVPSFN